MNDTLTLSRRPAFSRRRVGAILSAVALVALSAGWVGGGSALAAQAPPVVPTPGVAVKKVDICHSTNSTANPYVKKPSVGLSSLVPAPVGHTSAPDNTVGVFGIVPAGAPWGDVIPPFDWDDDGVAPLAHFPGQNWDAAGQVFFMNNCNLPGVVVHTLALNVAKTSDADADGTYSDGETAPFGGGLVTFQVKVENPTLFDLDVDSVNDVVDAAAAPGDPVTCDPALVGPGETSLGSEILAGSTYYCYFKRAVPAAADSVSTDTVTVSAHETGDAANTVSNHDGTTVTRGKQSARPTNAGFTGSACAVPSFWTVPNSPGVQYSVSLNGGAFNNVNYGDHISGNKGDTGLLRATAKTGYAIPPTADQVLDFGVLSGSCALPPPPPPLPVVIPVVVPPAPAPFSAPPVDEDLGISKTALEDSVVPGDVLSWSVNVTNVKGTPASAFTVTDVIPDGLTLLTAGADDWTCSNAGQTLSCTYSGAPLPVGSSSAFQIDSLVGFDFAGSEVSNTAVVDPGGVDTGNDSSTAVTPVVFTGGEGTAVLTPPAAAPTQGGGQALPFTGSYTDRTLPIGVAMLVLGLFLALAGRRRRTS